MSLTRQKGERGVTEGDGEGEAVSGRTAKFPVLLKPSPGRGKVARSAG